MQQSDIDTEIADLLDRIGGKRPPAFGRDTRLDTVGLDSLAKIDLAVAMEGRFSIAIPDEDLERFVTFGDLIDYLQCAGS